MQTLHKTLHKLHISLIIRTLRNVGFMFQTLHKSYTRTYTNPTQKRSKTIHKRKSYTETDTNATQNPTQKRSKTIHKTFHRALINYTLPNILVLNTKRAKCSEINETFNETINGH